MTLLGFAGVGVCLLVLMSWTPAALCAPAPADALFDDSQIHDLQLFLRASDWNKLKDNYLDDTYYPCELMWRGQTFVNAGVRSRGNGSRDGTKPSLRIDFNRYESAGEFLGLKSLVLNNLKQDTSKVRHSLSLLMFRRMGQPAPRAAYARLHVNNAYAGLYLMVEPIDKRFLKRVFNEDSGYLYDYDWAFEYHMEFLGPNPALYTPLPFQPKTHEMDPDPRALIEMIRVINQAGDAEFERAVGRFLDLRTFLSYLAVENYIGETDGMTGYRGTNNFYLYQFGGKTLFQFIAWDKDATFSWHELPVWENFESNVLVRRALSVPPLRRHYLESLLRCADVAGGPGGWLDQEAQTRWNLIRAAVFQDPFKERSNQEIEQWYEDLLYCVQERGGFVSAQARQALAEMN